MIVRRQINENEMWLKKVVPIIVTIIVGLLIISACGSTNPFPLSESGKYDIGKRQYSGFVDSNRDNRKISITVWYPAISSEITPPSDHGFDAQPNVSGAPYPLILSSAKVGNIFGAHLASHGFVVVGINGQDSESHWGQWLVDYPLDILFALDLVASQPLDGLEGMVDAEHAGAMGYSFDGYTSLALSGARVNPDFYLAKCSEASMMNPAPPQWWVEYICNMFGGWDKFVAQSSPAITISDNGLWQPMTDERILAVMPMAPEGAWLFGEQGLAAVDRPTLIIGASADTINLYDLEAVYVFEHLGTPDRAMITFVGEDHMMIYSKEPILQMKHFAVAFFGYHLNRQNSFARYFSEKFVSRHDNLAWGVYDDE